MAQSDADIDPRRTDGALSKREIKRQFKNGEIGYSDAVPMLMFDHDMELGEARDYLDR